MNFECDSLDAYLADELLPEAASRFVVHLDSCDECRHAVDEQRWTEELLRSGVRTSLETAPTSLVESIREAGVVRRRQRAQFVAGGFAAVAAVILIAVGWTFMFNRQVDRIAESVSAAQNATLAADTETPAANVPGAVRPQAVFIGTGEAIAVPIETSEENVTVVQLYPTTDTERRLRRELAFQSIQVGANGG